MPKGYYLTKEHRLAGQGAILLCAVLWSTSGLFIKLVDWNPVVIAGSRSFVAAIFLLTLRFFGRRKQAPGQGSILCLTAGGFNYAATMIIFVIANKLTASANAILLQYSSPVWAALLGWLLIKEKPHWEQWGALVMVSFGMLLFFRNGLEGGGLLGDCLALVSGLSFGANSVIMRMQKDGSPMNIMLLSHVICALFSIPFVFLYPPSPGAGSILCILFMGIFQIGAASALFAYGIRRIPAVQSLLTATIEPVLNPVWVLAVTGEKPAPSALVGGGVIVAAVVISSIIGKRRETA
ncbi:MAG: DMT family transporter [Treponema sp.]|jgi:drug/metabolite transporter (DMT)-like permease|nr:DMT family transporter [Treponema sp.]